MPGASDFVLDREEARADLESMTAKEHPFGSEAQGDLGDKLIAEMRQRGLTVVEHNFTADTPNPEALAASAASGISQTIPKQGRNILLGLPAHLEAPCTIALGSHYDTKKIDGAEYLGANDSGSSTVTLMQIMPFLVRLDPVPSPEGPCGFVGILFDGEESVLPEWNDGLTRHPARIQDNTYGSRAFVAEGLASQYRIRALILLDMIGSQGMTLTRDLFSTPDLQRELALVAAGLGLKHRLGSHTTYVADDHLPFLQAKIPAIDLIDFKNIEHWHVPSDTVDRLDLGSMEDAGKLAIGLARTLAAKPPERLGSR